MVNHLCEPLLSEIFNEDFWEFLRKRNQDEGGKDEQDS